MIGETVDRVNNQRQRRSAIESLDRSLGTLSALQAGTAIPLAEVARSSRVPLSRLLEIDGVGRVCAGRIWWVSPAEAARVREMLARRVT